MYPTCFTHWLWHWQSCTSYLAAPYLWTFSLWSYISSGATHMEQHGNYDSFVPLAFYQYSIFPPCLFVQVFIQHAQDFVLWAPNIYIYQRYSVHKKCIYYTWYHHFIYTYGVKQKQRTWRHLRLGCATIHLNHWAGGDDFDPDKETVCSMYKLQHAHDY